MTAEVTFVGDEAAMADLRKWAEQVGPEVVKAATPFVQRVADTVAGAVPHLTGQLAGSVTTSEADDGAGVGYDGSVPYDRVDSVRRLSWPASRAGGTVPLPVGDGGYGRVVRAASSTTEDTVGRFSWSTPTTV